MIVVADTEVFKYDWILVASGLDSDEYVVIHNDNDAVKTYINNLDEILCGFNMKGYDYYIIKAICLGADNLTVKSINDWIIKDNKPGWQHPFFDKQPFTFKMMDIMDDMQTGVSLKSIEAHLFMDIEETEVSFDLDRELTDEELALTIRYCKYDVDSTKKVVKLRKEYLDTKLLLAKEKGWEDSYALSLTNAKLTAAYLGAEKPLVPYHDEREYVYPDNLKTEIIPEEVIEFFDRMHDKTISDEELFGTALKIELNGCPVTLGYGGIHGALNNYIEEADEQRTIINEDVASYYPHLIINNGYYSRNITNPLEFNHVVETRMIAKKNGDKKKANAYKLIINTTFGASLDKYNNLYDALMGRSICVSGQLYLIELAVSLCEIPTLKLIQLNTDGIMVSVDTKYMPSVESICNEWQQRTGFELEADHIKKIIQKDVNNYLEIGTKGEQKTKGAYFKTGVSTAGAFSINNNHTIVVKAILDYFVKGISVSETIGNCNDIKEFQIIAKASGKYKGCFQYVKGQRVEVQRCNRVYATKDTRYSTLYKYKSDKEVAKISNLPAHCIVDNKNQLTVADIDKSYYIDLATKRINDFYGREGGLFDMPAKKSEETTNASLNVYQKFFKAKQLLLKKQLSKSGKNPSQRYTFFELADIVPAIEDVLGETELLAIFTFTSNTALLKIVNIDDSADSITFEAPMKDLSDLQYGTVAANVIQTYGAELTYMRRYLLLAAFNLIEQDQVDNEALPQEAPKPKTPATVKERATIVTNLTNVEGQADELQLKGLKVKCSELYQAANGNENIIRVLTQIADATKNFTECKKTDCEKYMMAVTNQLAELLPF